MGRPIKKYVGYFYRPFECGHRDYLFFYIMTVINVRKRANFIAVGLGAL